MQLMRTVAAALLCTMLFSTIHAQNDTTYYFSIELGACDKEDADWYRKVAKSTNKDGWYAYTEYRKDGTVDVKGYALNPNGAPPIGKSTEYYSDGITIEKEGTYKQALWNNKSTIQDGTWMLYWENGKKFAEREYRQDAGKKYAENLLINHWDSLGVQRVTNGNGIYTNIFTKEHDPYTWYKLSGKVVKRQNEGTWTCTYSDGKPSYIETYKAGELLKGTSYDKQGKKYKYTKIEEAPEFKGGEAALIKFLQVNITYPAVDKDNDVQGKVLIRFVVGTDGGIEQAKVVRSVSPTLDKEGLRVVNMLPKFTPGKQRGQAVKVLYTLPLVFKLT